MDHYGYCKNRDCSGCLPTDEELATMHIMALWGEMAARCVAQTPATKTRQGAFDALVADGPNYRELVAGIRAKLSE